MLAFQGDGLMRCRKCEKYTATKSEFGAFKTKNRIEYTAILLSARFIAHYWNEKCIILLMLVIITRSLYCCWIMLKLTLTKGDHKLQLMSNIQFLINACQKVGMFCLLPEGNSFVTKEADEAIVVLQTFCFLDLTLGYFLIDFENSTMFRARNPRLVSTSCYV